MPCKAEEHAIPEHRPYVIVIYRPLSLINQFGLETMSGSSCSSSLQEDLNHTSIERFLFSFSR
jgi:hypothetical protein